MKHPIPVRIPEELQQKLRLEAQKEGLSMSAVIRRVIIRHCAAQNRKKVA